MLFSCNSGFLLHLGIVAYFDLTFESTFSMPYYSSYAYNRPQPTLEQICLYCHK
jgi:hypothetical protein